MKKVFEIVIQAINGVEVYIVLGIALISGFK